MQPYGSDSHNDKGLFTFYREQQEAQNGLKNKINSDRLQKILAKTIKLNHEDKRKQLEEREKQKIPTTDRPYPKNQNPLEIKSSSISTNREQLRLKRSLIDEPTSVKPQMEHKLTKNTLHTMNNSAHQSIFGDEEQCNNQSFHRYLSEFDTLKLKKKAIIQESQSSHQNPIKKSESPSPKKQNEQKIDQKEKIKCILHFKKMALQPQEFEGFIEVNKKFAPLGLHKRQKSGLKSYRKQKFKALQLKKVDELPTEHKRKNSQQKFSVFDKDPIQNGPIPIPAPQDSSKKLIRVQKLSKKYQSSSDIDEFLTDQNKKVELFPKIKLNLPQVSCRYRQNNVNSMSVQLMKSNELKSKYQIRALEKQDENIISLNERLRSQFRNIRVSPKQLKHHISMNYSPSKEGIISERQLSSTDVVQKSQSTSIEMVKAQEMSFKKQKQIFCKRDEYLKGYVKKVKRSLISSQKSDQERIRSLMQEKKRVIIQNLMEKLTFA